jgi:hypothetical protein
MFDDTARGFLSGDARDRIADAVHRTETLNDASELVGLAIQ